jgi:WXG100 family type VII secretion target
MAEAFSVDPESLSDALERMDAFQRLSTALLAEIDSVVKNLHVDWDAAAAAAHAEAHQEWSHGAAQMDQALQTLQHSGQGGASELHPSSGDQSEHVVLTNRTWRL